MKILQKIAPYIDLKKHRCAAVIVAGGSGSRMKTAQTKQMTTLCSMPVVARSIAAFESCNEIKEIVIVAKKGEETEYAGFIRDYGFKKIKTVVCGGATRQESVMNGFNAISERCDYVAIHDGCRCLITTQEIKNVIKNAYKYGAATAAVPAKDTVKLADEKGFIDNTPERRLVWQAQTPQVFNSKLYRAAAYYAKKKGFEGTDDNSLCEWLGTKVKLVQTSYENIKITTPEDMELAKIIIERRQEARND